MASYQQQIHRANPEEDSQTIMGNHQAIQAGSPNEAKLLGGVPGGDVVADEVLDKSEVGEEEVGTFKTLFYSLIRSAGQVKLFLIFLNRVNGRQWLSSEWF